MPASVSLLLEVHLAFQARSVRILCRTQDFATPRDKRFNMPLSQAGSQAAIIPALGPPPTFDAPGKRGRKEFELTPSTGEWYLYLILLMCSLLLSTWKVKCGHVASVPSYTSRPTYSQHSCMQVVWMLIHSNSTLHHNHFHVRLISLLLDLPARISILSPTKN